MLLEFSSSILYCAIEKREGKKGGAEPGVTQYGICRCISTFELNPLSDDTKN